MKVLNFGSLNIDYVYSVDHFVRAGETLSSDSLNLFCGGKGLNQSVAFARAGAETYHAGCIGNDGSMLTDMLSGSGVNTKYIRRSDDVKTGHAIIQVTHKGENCILLYGGANQTVTDEMADEVLSGFGEGDLLMLQNEINNLGYIISQAKKRGMFIALNPSPFDEKITALDLSLVDALIVNETEGCGITGKTSPDDILTDLLSRYPEMKIVLTVGKNGALYADKNGRCSCGIIDIKVVDTTAAGDTFTGYFFSSLMSGASPLTSLRFATAASTLAVSRKGAAPSIPARDEVVELMKASFGD